MARIHTAPLSMNKGEGYLNITRQTGNVIFAPSWDLLKIWKKMKRWDSFEAGYLEEMRVSYREHRKDWQRLLELEEVTLMCYCPAIPLCHRYVLASKILTKLGCSYEGERTGE